MLTLSIQSDDRRPVSARVDRLPCRIGKHRDNEVVLPSWRVARVHAEIHKLERGFKLVDCGSIGGTPSWSQTSADSNCQHRINTSYKATSRLKAWPTTWPSCAAL